MTVLVKAQLYPIKLKSLSNLPGAGFSGRAHLFILQRSNYVGIKEAAIPTRPLNQAVANCHVRDLE